MFLEKLQNCGVPEGYPVRLECRVVGMPPPIFYWKKDNETIPSNRERMRYCHTHAWISCACTHCFHEKSVQGADAGAGNSSFHPQKEALKNSPRWLCISSNSVQFVQFFKLLTAVQTLFPCGGTVAVPLVQAVPCLREWGQSLWPARVW